MNADTIGGDRDKLNNTIIVGRDEGNVVDTNDFKSFNIKEKNQK